ncbi:MAG: hypothetical protein ACF8PN_02755 [Phycisphaerales bacterium]
MKHRSSQALWIACAALITLPGWAQDATPPAEIDPAAPLAGPKVEDAPAPGVAMSFSESQTRFQPRDRVSLRFYIDVISRLDGVSEAQTAEGRMIATEYFRTIREYDAAHKKEIAKLLEQFAQFDRGMDDHSMASDRVEPATDTDSPRGRNRAANLASMMRSIDPSTLAPEERERFASIANRFREIRENRPSDEPVKLALWNLLTPAQQSQFEQELEISLERRRRAREAQQDAMAPMDASGEPGMDSARDRRRLARLDVDVDLDSLTPAQRRRYERFVQERDRMRELRRQNPPEPPSRNEIEFEDPSEKKEPIG